MNLRWISLCDCILESLPFDLDDKITFPNLEGIDLTHNKIADISNIYDFIKRERCPNLLYINLRKNPVASYKDDVLVDVLKCNPNVFIVNNYTSNPSYLMKAYVQKSAVESILSSLEGRLYEDIGQYQIRSIIRAHRVDQVVFNQDYFDQADLPDFDPLSGHSNYIFQQYSKYGNNFCPGRYPDYSQYIDLGSVTVLNLQGEEIAAIDLTKFRNLEICNLNNCNQLRDIKFTEDSNPNLKIICINGIHSDSITPSFVHAFETLALNKTLPCIIFDEKMCVSDIGILPMEKTRLIGVLHQFARQSPSYEIQTIQSPVTCISDHLRCEFQFIKLLYESKMNFVLNSPDGQSYEIIEIHYQENPFFSLVGYDKERADRYEIDDNLKIAFKGIEFTYYGKPVFLGDFLYIDEAKHGNSISNALTVNEICTLDQQSKFQNCILLLTTTINLPKFGLKYNGNKGDQFLRDLNSYGLQLVSLQLDWNRIQSLSFIDYNTKLTKLRDFWLRYNQDEQGNSITLDDLARLNFCTSLQRLFVRSNDRRFVYATEETPSEEIIDNTRLFRHLRTVSQIDGEFNPLPPTPSENYFFSRLSLYIKTPPTNFYTLKIESSLDQLSTNESCRRRDAIKRCLKFLPFSDIQKSETPPEIIQLANESRVYFNSNNKTYPEFEKKEWIIREPKKALNFTRDARYFELERIPEEDLLTDKEQQRSDECSKNTMDVVDCILGVFSTIQVMVQYLITADVSDWPEKLKRVVLWLKLITLKIQDFVKELGIYPPNHYFELLTIFYTFLPLLCVRIYYYKLQPKTLQNIAKKWYIPAIVLSVVFSAVVCASNYGGEWSWQFVFFWETVVIVISFSVCLYIYIMSLKDYKTSIINNKKDRMMCKLFRLFILPGCEFFIGSLTCDDDGFSESLEDIECMREKVNGIHIFFIGIILLYVALAYGFIIREVKIATQQVIKKSGDPSKATDPIKKAKMMKKYAKAANEMALAPRTWYYEFPYTLKYYETVYISERFLLAFATIGSSEVNHILNVATAALVLLLTIVLTPHRDGFAAISDFLSGIGNLIIALEFLADDSTTVVIMVLTGSAITIIAALVDPIAATINDGCKRYVFNCYKPVKNICRCYSNWIVNKCCYNNKCCKDPIDANEMLFNPKCDQNCRNNCIVPTEDDSFCFNKCFFKEKKGADLMKNQSLMVENYGICTSFCCALCSPQNTDTFCCYAKPIMNYCCTCHKANVAWFMPNKWCTCCTEQAKYFAQSSQNQNERMSFLPQRRNSNDEAVSV